MENSHELTEADKKKMVSDGVFWVLAQEQKHPVFKRADVLKNIGIAQKGAIRDELWDCIRRDLKRIFGYVLHESTQKKGEYYLVNKIPDAPNGKMKHLKFNDEDIAHHGLLTTILTLIYMNNEVIKSDTLENFLIKMKLWDSSVGKKDRSRFGEVDPSVVKIFGDVKGELIDKEWVKRRYIEYTKVQDCDPDNPQYEYRWGERAHIEFDKKDILKFVAKIYDKPVSAFCDQYQKIIREEGDDVFGEEGENEQPKAEAMETE